MGYEIKTKIDKNRCTGCGLCVKVCPYNSLSLKNGKAFVSGEYSMHCGQCSAVCRYDAVTVEDLDVFYPQLSAENQGVKRLFDTVSMRRSCRHYTDEVVDDTKLRDLVTFGVWAPSGTNSQKWAFTIVPDRNSMISFASLLLDVYKKINKMASNPFYRFFSKIFLKDILGKYYKRYYNKISDGIKGWEENRKDILFHGAPSAIIVSVDESASCAAADGVHAASNILLAAHEMNLGTCLIGFAVKAMKRDKNILKKMGIPQNHVVYSVIAVGHPALKYYKPSGRKEPEIRYFKK